MYDIRQFRPALYTLVLMGMTGFALASQSPGLWVLSAGAVLLNAWLVMTGRFRPLPRFIANIVTLLALVYVALVVRQGALTPILIVGQFLVFLQIVKLFEQRANRDYAQLLVLSLLLMVAASISTAKLEFGLLLVAYLFLSLYCCLLFHLKVETDYAKQAIGVPDEKINLASLRQDQRYLSRSMRRLTAFVSIASVGTAVAVFLFFPRGSGAMLLGPLQFRPSQTLSGFNDQLSFQNIAAITQNQALVAYVTVYRDDEKVQGNMPLLLRGTTLDVYHGADDSAGAWQWTRSNMQPLAVDVRPGETRYFVRRRSITTSEIWRQEITLEPTGTPVLFAIAGARQMTPAFDGRILYSPFDAVIQTSDPIQTTLRYTVVSTGRLQDMGPPPARGTPLDAEPESQVRGTRRAPATSSIDPRILQMARLPGVSGFDEEGPLAARRPFDERVTSIDLQIAQNIEAYLRTNFGYTLDLTDARRTLGEDPMVSFLYDFKRGHCEYFAGAMTLMCQSLGMQARVVIGFKCDDYNNIGGYFMVRQSHAHAWVEVLGDDKLWHTFDPTSSRDAPQPAASAWTRFRHLINYLEFTWANSVIAYDREQRTNVITSVNDSLSNTAIKGAQTVDQIKKALTVDTDAIAPYLAWLIRIMIAGLVVAVLWYVFERWKLRRRARRIGLSALPHTLQLKLARQLGFYDDLMRLLARHSISRPTHLTPMEFSSSLSFLPNEAFDTIRRLTEVFYRVRFGRTHLTHDQQRRLHRVINRVDDALAR